MKKGKGPDLRSLFLKENGENKIRYTGLVMKFKLKNPGISAVNEVIREILNENI